MMRALRIHTCIDMMRLDEISRPVPGAGEMPVAVKAAGLGPWDQLVRGGRCGIGQTPPLVLGSNGTMVAFGAGGFALRDAVCGATSDQCVGGYAEYTLVEAGKVAPKPAAATGSGRWSNAERSTSPTRAPPTACWMAPHKPAKIVLKVSDRPRPQGSAPERPEGVLACTMAQGLGPQRRDAPLTTRRRVRDYEAEYTRCG
jgi:hypothetical protein